ncbi:MULTISPECIES: YciI family protein [Marinomonas]|uniref:YciI family protein n=1 Tax=Marinomonas rhodophyticola TaxID=2992803 RepID=A0ABT3KBH8_9GAMM|nr:YciI family protein [Marinomonas sp. KJ51-3]MCW4627888.1 YciI family protein [Marinomonas sp. KJ51-3]
MQFVVTAFDYEDALERRLEHREAHLSGLRAMAKQGTFISGGAMVNEEGKMIGSNVHVAFPDLAALQAWLDSDPFTVHKVWETTTIHEIKLLAID